MQITLIDKYLPEYTYNEYHQIIANSSVKNCFETARHLDMSESLITKILMKLRGLPTKDLTLSGFVKNIGFTMVAENPYVEFVIDASQRNTRIIWNFYFEEIGKNKTLASTETRISCLTKKSKKAFLIYWFFVKPFSGLIRMEILRLIKKNAEKIIA